MTRICEPALEVRSALQLIRRGRFAETVSTLKQFCEGPQPLAKKDLAAQVLLADALQRIGQNQNAEIIASKHLPKVSAIPSLYARYHLILGNVLRERGDLPKAIQHFQVAVANANSDHELTCWTQLRLMTAIGELSGREIALAHLDSVKRALARLGDARPFAALHLWFVETDAMRGDVNSARRHLKTSESLLSQVDDVWLRGYLAINSSVVHYYCAEIDEARRWAEIAILNARESGHRTTKRAAYANLGYFDFAVGELARAEEYFATALECCERGSANEVAILDNIAETKLQRGDLDGCRRVLSELDTLVSKKSGVNGRHYNAWALQTKVRLMLREGRKAEARRISDSIEPLIDELPQARVTTESRLLAAETLLESEPAAAAESFSPILSSKTQLAPDLFAEAELVTGKMLEVSGAFQLARVHLERAVHTFDAIGHLIGKERSLSKLGTLPPLESHAADDIASQRTLDRFRALLDLRTRPELFGCEAVSLLRELNCSSDITLVAECGGERRAIRSFSDDTDTESTGIISIRFGADTQRPVTLSFTPLRDSKSKLTSLSFRRIIEQLLAMRSSESNQPEHDVVWTASAGTPVTDGVVFASEAMLGVLRTVKQIAPTDVSVLITGETGAGKEVVARAVHEHSHRSAMPFLALNCAAVPKDLLESQLFGHRKGAFSGAGEAHQGIVRAANGGTLFLDEIGEIPVDVQAKLLRFLEMSEVHPVGESHPVKVNVRLIFATNGDLEEAVRQNRFRQDLFYRLNVIPIKVPPLRERREEIPVLANLFAQRFAAEFGKEPVRFSSSAMELLIVYTWPGNIRQLANEVRRLTALTESGVCITPDDLSAHLQAQKTRIDAAPGVPQMHVRIDQPLEKATAHLEAEMIKHALRQAQGRVSVAASTLGISRKGLYLKRLRLGLTDFKERAN
jgi:DNA-binding NtrC family response regulator/tetratricopeptide (TPR) repeat protein